MSLPTQLWKNWVSLSHLHPVLKATAPSPIGAPTPAIPIWVPLIISFIITIVVLIVINNVLLLRNSQGGK